MRGRGVQVLGALVIGLALSACASPSPPDALASPDTSAPSAPALTEPSATPDAAPGTALAALDGLRVAGRGAKTGYDRSAFGSPWLDVDRNGCDTRNDILARDLTSTIIKPGTRGCVVLSGIRDDPYTGRLISFVRGGPSELDIDHVVALGNAWVSGGAAWSYGRRIAFANDPLNLLAVDASANRQKGDGDAATWLPPNKAFRCAYVARQIGVKSKFALTVTPAEKSAMQRVLQTCPQQRVARGGGPTDSPLREPPRSR